MPDPFKALDNYKPAGSDPFEALDSYDPTKPTIPKTTLGDRASDLAVSAVKGAIGLSDMGIGLLDVPTGGKAGKLAEQLGYRSREANQILDQAYSPAQQKANQEVYNAEGFIPTLKAVAENPSVIPHQLIQNTPTLLGGGAISRGVIKLTPTLSPLLAGAIGEGAATVGQNLEQTRQQLPNGELDTLTQTTPIAASGVLTGAIAAASGGLANKFGLSDVQQLLTGVPRVAKEGAKFGAKDIAKNLTGTALNEGLQEGLQSPQEQVAQNYAQGLPLTQGAGNAAALGAVTGAVMGVGGAVIDPSTYRTDQGPLSRAISNNPIIQSNENNQTNTQPNTVIPNANQFRTTANSVNGSNLQPDEKIGQSNGQRNAANELQNTQSVITQTATQPAPGQDNQLFTGETQSINNNVLGEQNGRPRDTAIPDNLARINDGMDGANATDVGQGGTTDAGNNQAIAGQPETVNALPETTKTQTSPATRTQTEETTQSTIESEDNDKESNSRGFQPDGSRITSQNDIDESKTGRKNELNVPTTAIADQGIRNETNVVNQNKSTIGQTNEEKTIQETSNATEETGLLKPFTPTHELNDGYGTQVQKIQLDDGSFEYQDADGYTYSAEEDATPVQQSAAFTNNEQTGKVYKAEKPPIEPDFNASQNEWNTYNKAHDDYYGKADLTPTLPKQTKTIEQQKNEREQQRKDEQIKSFKLIPESVKRGAELIRTRNEMVSRNEYVDGGYSNQQDSNDAKAYLKWKRNAKQNQLKALSDYERYIKNNNDTIQTDRAATAAQPKAQRAGEDTAGAVSVKSEEEAKQLLKNNVSDDWQNDEIKNRVAKGILYGAWGNDPEIEPIIKSLSEQERIAKKSGKSIFDNVEPVAQVNIWEQPQPARESGNSTSMSGMAAKKMSQKAIDKFVNDTKNLGNGKEGSLWSNQVINAYKNKEFTLNDRMSYDARALIDRAIRDGELQQEQANESKIQAVLPNKRTDTGVDEKTNGAGITRPGVQSQNVAAEEEVKPYKGLNQTVSDFIRELPYNLSNKEMMRRVTEAFGSKNKVADNENTVRAQHAPALRAAIADHKANPKPVQEFQQQAKQIKPTDDKVYSEDEINAVLDAIEPKDKVPPKPPVYPSVGKKSNDLPSSNRGGTSIEKSPIKGVTPEKWEYLKKERNLTSGYVEKLVGEGITTDRAKEIVNEVKELRAKETTLSTPLAKNSDKQSNNDRSRPEDVLSSSLKNTTAQNQRKQDMLDELRYKDAARKRNTFTEEHEGKPFAQSLINNDWEKAGDDITRGYITTDEAIHIFNKAKETGLLNELTEKNIADKLTTTTSVDNQSNDLPSAPLGVTSKPEATGQNIDNEKVKYNGLDADTYLSRNYDEYRKQGVRVFKEDYGDNAKRDADNLSKITGREFIVKNEGGKNWRAIEKNPTPILLKGSLRNPHIVNAFNPYLDGDIVKIGDKQWQIKNGDRGWYLTDTGNWKGEHPVLKGITGQLELIRDIERAVDKELSQTKESTQSTPTKDTIPSAPRVSDKQTEAKNKTHLENHEDINNRIEQGDISADELKQSFESLVANKDKVIAELSKLTKEQLAKNYNVGYARSDDKKSDYVNNAYKGMLADYKISSDLITYSFDPFRNETGESPYVKSVRKFVESTTDESLKEYAQKRQQAKAEREAYKAEAEKGMQDPQTLDDYMRLMKSKMSDGKTTFGEARMTLTPDQREQYDSLMAEKTRGDRKARADQQKTQVRATAQSMSGQILESKHTKTGEPLFVVQTAERVERDVYNDWNATAKRMGGYYSSYRGNGAIPGFTFKSKENAEAFLKYLGGDVTQAKEAIEQRRDAYADDKSQTAVERLNEMADKLEGKADTSLNQERRTNTTRQGNIASRMEAAARADIAMAETMRNIAKAIDNGQAKLLDRVRQKVQVELLQSMVSNAHYTESTKKAENYGEQEKIRQQAPTKETADYVEFPNYTMYRSDWANLGRQLSEQDGTKKIGEGILKVANDVTKEYLKFAKDNIHKVSTFSITRGEKREIASFTSKTEAENAISRGGFKGKAIVLPFKRGENVIILSPSEAVKLGIWTGDNDKRISLTSDAGNEIVEKIGKSARRGSKVSVPWQLENAYDKQKRLSAMGIETPAELRAAIREFISLREAPKEADKIKQMERAMIGRKNDGLDFFPTPVNIADEMIAAADIKDGMTVLEPSAGMGHIADRIRESGVEPDVIELSGDRKELLEAKGYNVVGRDFMDVNGGYDRIIMNPPFSDRRDMEHVQHAYDMLNPGGRLVSIVGEGVFFGRDKKAQAFRDWLDQVGGTDEKLEANTFNDPSLPVNTGTNARIVVIDKPLGTGTDDTKYSQSVPVKNAFTPQKLTAYIAAKWKAVKADLDSGNAVIFKNINEVPDNILRNGEVLVNGEWMPSIEAWRGGLRDYNSYDSSHIGEGAGGSQHGHGIYFNTLRSIGEWYRDAAVTRRMSSDNLYVGDQRVIDSVNAYDMDELTRAIVKHDKKRALNYVEDKIDQSNKFNPSESKAWNDLYNDIMSNNVKFVPHGGVLSKVNIAPEESEFLNWDKPISEQSDVVKRALQGFTGTGGEIYKALAKDLGSAKAASDWLQDKGVRGNVFEDKKSNSKDYVVFSDKDVEIAAKYAKQKQPQGFYLNGKTYFLSDALNRDNVDSTIVHEYFHKALAQDPKLKERLTGVGSELNAIFEDARSGKAKGAYATIYNEAAKRVANAETAAKDATEEFMAYSAGEFAKNPKSLPDRLRIALRKLIAIVKTAIYRVTGFIYKPTPADLAQFAIQGMGRNVVQSPIFNKTAMVSMDKSLPDTININGVERSNADIKFSVAMPSQITNAVEQGDKWLSSFLNQKNLDTGIYNLQDRFIDLKRQLEKIVKTGRVIPEEANPYLTEEGYHQSRAYKIQQFTDNEVIPLLTKLHDSKIPKEKFEQFLHARHAPSRNAEMQRRNPNQEIIDANLAEAKDKLAQAVGDKEQAEARREVDKWSRAQAFDGTEEQRLSLSGLTDKQSSDFIDSLSDQERETLTELGDMVDNISNETLDLLVKYGMEKPETVQKLKDQWEHHVPLHRDEAHPEQNNFGQPIGKGFSISGSGMMQATGSNADVTHILAHLIEAREQMITRGEKNKVNIAMANFIKAYPDDEFAKVGKPDFHDKLVNGLVETVRDPIFVQKQRDNVVMMRIDGKDIPIVFNENKPENIRLALSLKNMDGDNLDLVESFIGKGTRFMASMNTQYNLVFGLFNMMRDTQGMALNLSSTELRGKQKQVLIYMPEAIKTIFGVTRKQASVDPVLAKRFDEFNTAGATTGFSQMFKDIQSRDKFIEQSLKELDYGKIGKSALWIKKALSDFNTVMENGTRFAVYMAARDAGLSTMKSASLAKNVTVNFNRKGAYTTKMGAFYAFFNASMQGTARTLETLKGPQGKKILMGGVALGAITTLVGIAAMGADDWEKIPEFVRERSLILPAPGGGYISIPMPLGFHLLPNIGRKLVESFMGSEKVTPQHRFLQLAGSTVEAFNPLGGGDLSTAIMPTVLDPALALWRNKDWTGKPIYKEDYNSLKPTPGFSRTKDTATVPAKGLAQLINTLTGGDAAKQGLWSPTPDQIDYIMGQILGGTGRELSKAEQTIESTLSGEDLPAYKVPLLGKLYGSTKGNEVEYQAYHNNLVAMYEHEAEIKYLIANNKRNDISKYLKDNPAARLITLTKSTERAIGRLKDQRKKIKDRGGDTKAIDAQIVAKMKLLNDKLIS